MDAALGAGCDIVHAVDGVLDGLLLHLERDDLDILQNFDGGLMGEVVGSLQLGVLHLKLVELLAQVIECLAGSLTVGLGHSHVQLVQIVLEVALGLLLTCLALQDHCLGQLLTDLDNGVQGGHGVLEDHGDLIAADLVEGLLVDLQQILTIIDDLTGLGDGVGSLNTQNGLGGNRLTGTGLTNDGKGLALSQIEADVADSLNLAVAGAERDLKISDRQFCFHN